MTLIRELINIPEQVQEGDFVLKLTSGVDPQHASETVKQYVVTPQLAEAFDEALGLIASSVGDDSSRATYLHGSFGSGKSHFMAILHLLLQGNTSARDISELQAAVDKWDPKLANKRFLLVPLHFLTAKSMDATILGGYVTHVQELHPDAPLPAVFLGDEILKEELPHQRELLGDEKFLAELNRVAGGGDDAWGDFGSTWDLDRLERAIAGHDKELLGELTAAYISAFRKATTLEARNVGEGFINLDDGLSAISVHAESLGYDAIILFLDELILWLASNIGDLAFVQRESQKLTKLVEAENANRPVPIVSFVARQRDLRELVGDHIAGAELRSFSDNLELMKGRFGTITLEDRNLPVIARRRILRPVDEEAGAALRRAVDDALAGRDDIRQRLLTSDADIELFRQVYPFSPAAVQALIAVSEALQRERTALKVMLQLLVDRRDELNLGELIPVGDLWDVVAEHDEPFSAELKQAFETAKTLYRTKLEPMLLGEHGLTEDTHSNDPRWQAYEGDSRIVKTILLAALVERVEAFRNLDAARLVALNWGSVTSPISGRETTVLAGKLRSWNALAGELKIGDDPSNPTVSVALVNVDTGEIISRAIESFDTVGERRRTLRALIDTDLNGILGDKLFATVDHLWRGTERQVDVVFGNIRNTSELPDNQLMANGDQPKLIIDFPFDEQGRGPEDDLERLDRFMEDHGPTTTVCWIPSFFSAQGNSALRTYVALNELLRSDQRYEQHTSHLTHTQRQEARPILRSRRDQLREQLRNAILNAYGVIGGTNALVDPATSLTDHFRSLDPSMTVRPTTDPGLRGAFDQLCDQVFGSLYPGHPVFDQKVTPAQRRTTWTEVARALGETDWRITVENKNRSALRNVANALELGTMHESHFIVSSVWKDRLDRHLDAARKDGSHLTVAELRALIDDPSGKRRGLPSEIADLVVLTVSAQTDHAITHLGSPVISDGGTALPADGILVKQQLPSASDWEAATKRAGHVFGVTASPLVSAPEVARFAEQVKQKAAALIGSERRLVDQLGVALTHAGLDHTVNRGATAQVGADLVAAIKAADEPQDVIDALAGASIPMSATAVGRSLATSAAVADALADTNWGLLKKAGYDAMEPLRALLTNDEITQSYDPERIRLEREAPGLIGPAITEPGGEGGGQTQPDAKQHRSIVSREDDLNDVISDIKQALADGPIEITWHRTNTE